MISPPYSSNAPSVCYPSLAVFAPVAMFHSICLTAILALPVDSVSQARWFFPPHNILPLSLPLDTLVPSSIIPGHVSMCVCLVHHCSLLSALYDPWCCPSQSIFLHSFLTVLHFTASIQNLLWFPFSPANSSSSSHAASIIYFLSTSISCNLLIVCCLLRMNSESPSNNNFLSSFQFLFILKNVIHEHHYLSDSPTLWDNKN